jgi:hypothetical protein
MTDIVCELVIEPRRQPMRVTVREPRRVPATGQTIRPAAGQRVAKDGMR